MRLVTGKFLLQVGTLTLNHIRNNNIIKNYQNTSRQVFSISYSYYPILKIKINRFLLKYEMQYTFDNTRTSIVQLPLQIEPNA